jgi:hypothetical protein
MGNRPAANPLRKSSTPDVTINDIQIPRKTEIKYLRMIIDSKLTWKQHIVKKLGRKSNLAIENKLLIYKTIILQQIITTDIRMKSRYGEFTYVMEYRDVLAQHYRYCTPPTSITILSLLLI